MKKYLFLSFVNLFFISLIVVGFEFYLANGSQQDTSPAEEKFCTTAMQEGFKLVDESRHRNDSEGIFKLDSRVIEERATSRAKRKIGPPDGGR